jgi:molybdate transport system substrate-binding protein
MIRTFPHFLTTLSLSLLLAIPSVAAAVEVRVICTHALTPAVEQLKADYEKSTGNKLVVIDATSADAMKRIHGGESFDLAILLGPAIRDLAKQGKLDPASVTDLAITGVGIAVKKGAPKPDISTVEAFRKTLLAAKSIAYSEAGGSGIHFADVVKRMGLTEQLKPKTTLVGGGGAVGPLAVSGQVELAVQMKSELYAVKGIDYVGPLPGEYGKPFLFSGAIFSNSKNVAGAKSLIQLLTSKKAEPVLLSTGMDLIKR